MRATTIACGVAVALTLANGVAATSARGASCPRTPTAGADVTGCDFHSRNLRGLDLRGVNFSHAILTGADLRGVDLRGAKVVAASLMAANLARANLRGANLTSSHLVGADLTNTDLSRANLTRARLDGVEFSSTTLRDAILVGTSLQWAQLRGADLTGAKLVDVVLDGADLQGVAGVSDAALSSALGVDSGQLGREVKAHAITLETEDAVVNALRPACTSGAVNGAGSVPGATFHPMVTVGLEPDSNWTPPAVRFAEIVACVDPDVAEVVETCPYTTISGPNVGETIYITRNQHSRRVRVVNATNGALVSDQLLTGPAPDACPDFTSSRSPIGAAVADSDVTAFLQPFVGDVPTIVQPPPVSIPLALSISPRSGPAGTKITVKTSGCDGALQADLKNPAGSIVATAPPAVRDMSVVTVPQNASHGRYTMVVTCTAPPMIYYGDARFTVTSKES